MASTEPATSQNAAPPNSASNGKRKEASISESGVSVLASVVFISLAIIQKDWVWPGLAAPERSLFRRATPDSTGRRRDFAIRVR